MLSNKSSPSSGTHRKPGQHPLVLHSSSAALAASVRDSRGGHVQVGRNISTKGHRSGSDAAYLRNVENTPLFIGLRQHVYDGRGAGSANILHAAGDAAVLDMRAQLGGLSVNVPTTGSLRGHPLNMAHVQAPRLQL